MHPNPVFRTQDEAEALATARARGFGVITLAGPGGPLAAHVPFVLDDGTAAGEALRLEAHLMRSNPIARALRDGPLPALLIVSGPDGYVSPDWYGEADRVPTWNYVAVHLRGLLRLAGTPMRDHLDRVSAAFESRLPKPAWTAAKMTPEVLERMMRTILPVEMAIERVESTVKLNQNRTASARAGAIAAIEAGGTPGQETAALAALMRGVADDGS